VERPELTLVTEVPARAGKPAAAGLGLVVLAAAVVATVRGADSARRPFDAAGLAENALTRTLAANDPAPAREAGDALRAHLRANPLDAASRTVAASLLAETATNDAERAAAAAQAQAATRLVKTDEWITAGAARVLTRCGRADLALGEIARMFDYAPPEAAATLLVVEPWVQDGRIEDGIPPTPAAWLAWTVRLRLAGREADADERLAALLARWPGDLPALSVAASAAAGHNRIDELRRLLPPSLILPETKEAAPLYAYRARLHAGAGDKASARADAVRAVALSHDDPWVMALAGDALIDNEPALAREYWTRALYRLLESPSTRAGAVWLRARLARLDDREGRAGDALREWRAVLAELPDNGEARNRVAALTGQ
jgi:hypothetical protein